MAELTADRLQEDNWVRFDKLNTALLTAMGFVISDEPGHGESASVIGEMTLYVTQLANGELRLSLDFDGGAISADVVDLHEALIPHAGSA